ncbi:hypothetical protein Lser_V15G03847 [Lactuca serriola]
MYIYFPCNEMHHTIFHSNNITYLLYDFSFQHYYFSLISVRPMFSSTLLCLVLLHAVGALGFPETLKLERSFPTNHGVELKQLTERDGLRHHRILHKYADPNVVVGFGVYGTYDSFDVGFAFGGILGKTVIFDVHGSDLLWVGCKNCQSCPTSSTLQDERCSPKSNSCSDNQSTYDLHYGDGSGTSDCSCSTSETGQISQTERTLDGLMGLGRQSISVISQISSQGIALNSFGHCLAGGDGGGMLAFGTPVMPDLVFTPLVKSIWLIAFFSMYIYFPCSEMHHTIFHSNNITYLLYDFSFEHYYFSLISVRPMFSSTLLCLVLLHAVGALGFPETLKLERSFPINHGVELKQLTERDGLRHHRILHKYADPNVVVGFGVYGTYDPFDVGEATCCGSVAKAVNLALHHPHYKTKDVLQNPTHVQITNPPTISTMEMVVEHQLHSCSTSETGQISQTERTLDGIMGLGRQSISVISQISSQGIAQNSFGHCLAGGDGGGMLAFGTPVMTDLVFTPLVKSIISSPSLGFPETLKLERSFPTNHGVELKQLTERDGLRHHRILHMYVDPNVVVGFGVYGTYDPFDVGVLLSGVFWEKLSYLMFMEATCCGSVAKAVNLDLHHPHYKTKDVLQNPTHVQITNPPTISTMEMVVEHQLHSCSTSETGQISQTERTLDWLMGLGRQSISVISQISSQGIAPNSFGHCLAGGDGGGMLAFGTPVMPDLVFTPLVKSIWLIAFFSMYIYFPCNEMHHTIFHSNNITYLLYDFSFQHYYFSLISVRPMFSSTLLCLVLLHAVGALGFPETLKLERSFPTNHGVELKQITERDGLRHHRILHKYADPHVVVGFGVYGTYDPFDVGDSFAVGGILGKTVIFDVHGSDLLWVGCKNCQSCPTSSTLQDERCSPKSNSCSDNQSTYDLHYGDGSGTSDCCSTSETGQISQTERTLDGLMGLGRQSISVISQISSQGIAPNSFGHCLAGGDGGGMLAFGTPVMTDLVFTPLVKSILVDSFLLHVYILPL